MSSSSAVGLELQRDNVLLADIESSRTNRGMVDAEVCNELTMRKPKG